MASCQQNKVWPSIRPAWAVFYLAILVFCQFQLSFSFRRMDVEDCNQNTLESREDLADVILSGTVQELYPSDAKGIQKAKVEVKRIFKGFNIISELTNDRSNALSNAPSYRNLLVDNERSLNSIVEAPKRGSHFIVIIEGFGDPNLCKTKVNKFDTKIFLLVRGNNFELKLNSSVVRVTLQNLEHADALIKGVPFKPPTPSPQGPCDRYYCAFGAVCVENKTSNTPLCECIEKCHHVFSPVCGSDGVTYSSGCQLRKASCAHQKRITVRFPGACDVKDPCEGRVCSFGARCVPSLDLTAARCECPARCDSYGDNVGSSPVCGNDGIDYANMCEMRRAACRQMKDIRVKYYGKCDPCEGFECPVAQVCQLDDKRKPICRCNDLCNLDFSPVCASNGRTYSNDCLMRVEACKTRKEIHVVFRGECSQGNNPCNRLLCAVGEECNIDRQGRASCVCPQPCEPVLRPVCGTDQVTYDNECELRRQACIQRKSVNIEFRGPCGMDGPCRGFVCDHGATCVVKRRQPVCECPTCSEEFKPVCGTNGISYSNECKLRVENCERKTYVEVRQQGLCNGCNKMKCDFYSVCESDGKQARCVCPSQCVQRQSKVESKVCGTDGVTYQNECELKVAACAKKQLITIVSVGECDLCAKVRCKFGASCENGLCVCPMTCPSVYEPVCASDDQTYRNDCEMRRAACSQSIQLDAIYSRECDTDEMSGSGSGDEICDETTCRFGGTCALTSDNIHGCTCNFNCEAVREVVCGSDGSTYGNECLMREESCRRQEDITKQALENCDIEEEACDGKEPLINPLTSRDYDCDFQRDVCPANSYCHKGQSFAKCCPEDQTKSCWDTQYSCCPDGKTVSPGPYNAGCPSYCQCNPLGSFSTTCEPKSRQCTCKPGVGGLRCDRCEPGYWGLPRITEGNVGCIPCGCNIHGSVRDDCEQMTGRCMCKSGYTGMKCNICPDGRLLGPFGCDDNGRDSPVKCWELSCQFGSVCEETQGVAQCVCKGTCPLDERPALVCGNNGQTYGSECQLRLFACRLKQDISVAYPGACSATTTSSMTTLVPPTMRNSKFVARLTNEDSNRYLTKPTVKVPRPQELRRPSTSSPPPTDGDICNINPCQNGGSCRADKSLGFICLCPLGKGGAICNEEVAFGVPSFSGKSFLIMPGFSQVSKELTIELEFRALNKDGILLYTGQHSGGGDFVSIAVINGYVEFRFNLGSGPVTLRSRNPIELKKNIRVVARRYQKDGLLVVDDETGVQKSSPGSMSSLDLEENIYLGNVPDQEDDVFDRIGVNVGLVGCIEFLRAGRKENLREYKLNYPSAPSDIIDGGQITDCGESPCSSLPCLNGGTCIVPDNASHKCLCSKEYQGEYCEKSSSPCLNDPCQGGGICFATPDGDFECTCPADREGKFCEKVTMKSVSVPEFDGSAYLELPLTDYVGKHLSIEVWFKTLKPDGIILFSTQFERGSGDYFFLNLVNGTVEFGYDLGSGPARIKSAQPIKLDTWTSVVAQRLNKKGDMIIDGGKPVTGRSQGTLNELNFGESIYVGGYASILDLPFDGGIDTRFTGVIQRLYINGRLIEDLPSEATDLHNIGTYEGAPCHVNPCMNGGVCIPMLKDFACRCPIEYMGQRCQKAADQMNKDRPVSFDRTTFLQYDNRLTQSLKGHLENKFSLSFKTRRKNGLILFSNQGESVRGDYLSIAIIDGHIEFSFNLGKQAESNLFIVQSPVLVNDNKWHTITVQRDKRVGSLTVDDENPISLISDDGASQLDTDGILWLGGCANLPQGLPKDYYGGFKGCLKDVIIDNENLHLVDDRSSGMGQISFCGN